MHKFISKLNYVTINYYFQLSSRTIRYIAKGKATQLAIVEVQETSGTRWPARKISIYVWYIYVSRWFPVCFTHFYRIAQIGTLELVLKSFIILELRIRRHTECLPNLLWFKISRMKKLVAKRPFLNIQSPLVNMLIRNHLCTIPLKASTLINISPVLTLGKNVSS